MMNKGVKKIIEYTSNIQIHDDNGSVLSIFLSNSERLLLESALDAIEIKLFEPSMENFKATRLIRK
jgi:hypothetical protein